jgi:hypothetical protein
MQQSPAARRGIEASAAEPRLEASCAIGLSHVIDDTMALLFSAVCA